MKFNKISVNWLVFVIIFAVSLLFAYKITCFSYSFWDDTDTAKAFDFWEIFKHPANGIYVAGILDNFFGFYLPYKMNIHPSAFKSEYFSIFETIMLSGFALIWAKMLNRKFDFFYPIAYIFSFMLILFFCTEQSYMLFVYDGFFRMLLSAFLWVVMFNLYIKYVENTNIKTAFLLGITIFISAISSEFNCVLSLITFALILLFDLFKKSRDVKYDILFIIFAVLGALLMFHTGAFFRKPMTFLQINLFLSEIKGFLFTYFNYIIIKHIWAYVPLALCLIFANYKNNNIFIRKLTLFSLSTITGILIFFSSLFILGKTYFEENAYWIMHPDLHVMYNIFLCSLIFVFINIICQRLQKTKYIIFSLCFCLSICLAFYNYSYYKNFIKTIIIPEKTIVYKAEKIIRTAGCKNKPAYLFDETKNMWPFQSDSLPEKGQLYETSRYLKFINNTDKKFNFDNGIIFDDENKVMSEFQSNGGVFTEEELQKLDFNVVYNICK